MSRAKQILMAAGTFSIALGIGFVMQNGDALAGRFTDESQARSVQSEPLFVAMPQVPLGHMPTGPLDLAMPAVVLAAEPVIPVLQSPMVVTQAPLMTAITLPEDVISPSFAPDQIELAAVETSEVVTDALPSAPVEPVAAVPDCEPSLTARLGAAAVVDLTLSAPCAPDAAVIMHHQGMMFTILTDQAGQAQISVPALADVAVFVAELGGGRGAAASIVVPDLASYDRAVLQWQGQGGMELHALEFGAPYDSEGHVWAGAARDAAVAVAGTGGFITRLGDDRADAAMFAEIYTFPSGAVSHDGTVQLSVEAEVTAANCGRDVSAQSIQITPGADPSVIDLTMTMPNCSTVGEFLVLNNMLQDLTLAAR